ncbi:hypothetical protein ACOMHN_016214 [Nucella lapillus]
MEAVYGLLPPLLCHRQTFTLTGLALDVNLQQIAQDQNLPPSSRRCSRLPTLEDCLRDYRGLYMHVAASLGHKRTVRKLLDLAQMVHLDCNDMLTATDSHHDTALSLAVQNSHSEVVDLILDVLQRFPSPSVEFVLRHCVSKVCHSLRTCPNVHLQDVMNKVVVRGKQMKYDVSSSFSLLWYTYYRDEQGLEEFLFRRDTDLSYCSAILDPSLFHYAVYLFSSAEMGLNETCILSMIHDWRYSHLRSCDDPDEIRSLQIGHVTEINGTAAHFAISSLQPGSCASDGQGMLSSTDIVCTQSKEDENPVVQMLVYLEKTFHVKITKINSEGKTALDYLPPDADPNLVKVLTNYFRDEDEDGDEDEDEWEVEDEGEDEGEVEGDDNDCGSWEVDRYDRNVEMA